LATTVWEESKRLNGIIEDYLSLARSGGYPTGPVDLRELITDIEPMIQLEAERTGVIFTVVAPADQLTVIGNPDELKKALWNILTNALAVLPDGGAVTVTLSSTDAKAQIVVDDTGPGIATGDLARVFQPYFTTKSGGTGLGLAITHRIVTDHAGSIAIISPVPGRENGTQVVIRLPHADSIEGMA
jgi:signal transduction histidine kinase